MIRNVNTIINGWFNWALSQLGALDPKTKATAEARLKICEPCEHRVNHQCGKCGCLLVPKSMSDSKCPINKW